MLRITWNRYSEIYHEFLNWTYVIFKADQPHLRNFPHRHIGPFHFLSVSPLWMVLSFGKKSMDLPMDDPISKKIQLDFQHFPHFPYPYGWFSCLNIKSMDLPMDDLIIEKSSWKSAVFHRYKSNLKKNPDMNTK